MKKLTVNQVYQKTIPYEKNGEPRSFVKYAIKSGTIWYTLEGYGKKNVKEGDVISGIATEKTYPKKDGSRGTENIFKMLSPELADLYLRVEALEMYMNANNGTSVEKAEQIEGEEDLPF